IRHRLFVDNAAKALILSGTFIFGALPNFSSGSIAPFRKAFDPFAIGFIGPSGLYGPARSRHRRRWGLAGIEPARRGSAAARASDMAGRQIDQLGDPSVSAKERQ